MNEYLKDHRNKKASENLSGIRRSRCKDTFLSSLDIDGNNGNMMKHPMNACCSVAQSHLQANAQKPSSKSLWEPSFERDACGIGMIVNIKGERSHKLVNDAIEILKALTHRGGVGYEPQTGDGAGILLQKPHEFLRKAAADIGIELPKNTNDYGVAMVFSSPDIAHSERSLACFKDIILAEGLVVLGVRTVPVSIGAIGATALSVLPNIHQVFIARPEALDANTFERKLYIVSRLAQNNIRATASCDSSDPNKDPYFYLASISADTIVYKGMLLPSQLNEFYLDLKDCELTSAIALVHSRFSTNTFPSWERAHPMHHIIHNGEINTIRGNENWVKAREARMASALYGDELHKVFPVITADGSDSAKLDDFLNLLMHSGYRLHEGVLMAIPEPWEENEQMDEMRKALFEYQSCLVEPWDGPASVAFTDGRFAGAVLDRNGLRPSRYYVTDDNQLILASEVGVLPINEARIIRKDRLRPGRMLLIDTVEGRIIEDTELKATAAMAHPYREWLNANMLALDSLPVHAVDDLANGGLAAGDLSASDLSTADIDTSAINVSGNSLPPTLLQQQRIFGYSYEDLRLTIKAIAEKGEDPVSSMGYDAPIAILSERPQLLFSYFKQHFAQVTNPPIDAIREHLITSSNVHFGAEGNLLEPDAANCRMISHNTPILSQSEIARLRNLDINGIKSITLPIVFRADSKSNATSSNATYSSVVDTANCISGDTSGNASCSVSGDNSNNNTSNKGALKNALDSLFAQADAAIAAGCNIIILSDRTANATLVPIPSLLATSGLHHHLVRTGTRTQASIIVETGDAREAHHVALLVGYGANGVFPWLAYRIIEDMSASGLLDIKNEVDAKEKALSNYRKGLTNAIVKIASKMGISTVRSYHGAQIFEALGISSQVVDRYFTGTVSRIGGVGLSEIAAEAIAKHSEAFYGSGAKLPLDTGGDFKWRSGSEYHLLNPETIYYLQQACRQGNYGLFKKFSASIDNHVSQNKNIRGTLDIITTEKPIPLENVESAESIVQRFKTGAMSFGSISKEAHECMAIAMNNLRAKSNTGEGGEDPDRFVIGEDGLNRCSAIKQVASGRFGVTIHYLNNAKEIQIKMAQGAKPGEGGHLPGRKVYPWVAKNRFSTPGVELISPPPHHDIYSIEDLAQLIHDLKNANRDARISVKLVSEAGVGTIAVGVAKGLADVIVISGYDGGTGAAPRTSIRHAGLPWELGVAETHQSLLANRLRNRVRLETDGKLFTGRDIVVAALLGAEEFAFATAPLIAMGCDMLRVCNLDTCAAGIATQNPDLRCNFQGKPEHVQNFMLFVANEVREWMARIGVTNFTDLIGHVEYLRQTISPANNKAATIDLSRLLHQSMVPKCPSERYISQEQDHGLARELDLRTLVPLAKSVICDALAGKPTTLHYNLQISNRNRTVATVLSSEIVRALGPTGLPDNSINLKLLGSGGQSFGAFLAPGITLELHGDANDYLGKGLSGGRIIVTVPDEATYEPSENIIVGNVALYGATSGEVFIRGVAGERFCVRNSGARTVVEGTGDHGCEYMTGGRALILGKTGRNFAAGMSGGVAYVYDPDSTFAQNCNMASVSLSAVCSKTGLADGNENSEAIAEIRELLQKHVKYTGSTHAQQILDNFDTQICKFVMVVPNDYQKIIAAMKEAAQNGIPEEDQPLYAFNKVMAS
ncbi:MAG: glutamate synthase large subunit [Coriobacteriales bacterium]|jgi:glutamate synthase (ferredoxin)|nr:glutamate synthase large subunit [Coriobacteriales bacterium]